VPVAAAGALPLACLTLFVRFFAIFLVVSLGSQDVVERTRSWLINLRAITTSYRNSNSLSKYSLVLSGQTSSFHEFLWHKLPVEI
jgi:hypothetical protein